MCGLPILSSRDTFLFPLNRIDVRPHLYFVLTAPDSDRLILVVNITTWTPGFADKTVVLDSDCGHPFITHRSNVWYEKATTAKITDFERSEGILWQRRERCTRAVLQTLREGLLKSPHAKPKMQMYLKLQLQDAPEK